MKLNESFSPLNTYREMITKCDKCVEDFVQCFAWFVKQVFRVSCFALFRKKGQFLNEMLKEFCEIQSKLKENCAKHEKCVKVILSSFHVRDIFHKMTAKCLRNAISV